MYVSWDPLDMFLIFVGRPTWKGSAWRGEALHSDGDQYMFEGLPGFPVPAVPTLWEVTETGVKVVERVE